MSPCWHCMALLRTVAAVVVGAAVAGLAIARATLTHGLAAAVVVVATLGLSVGHA